MEKSKFTFNQIQAGGSQLKEGNQSNSIIHGIKNMGGKDLPLKSKHCLES